MLAQKFVTPSPTKEWVLKEYSHRERYIPPTCTINGQAVERVRTTNRWQEFDLRSGGSGESQEKRALYLAGNKIKLAQHIRPPSKAPQEGREELPRQNQQRKNENSDNEQPEHCFTKFGATPSKDRYRPPGANSAFQISTKKALQKPHRLGLHPAEQNPVSVLPKKTEEDPGLFSERISFGEFQRFFLEVTAKYRDRWPMWSSARLDLMLERSNSLGYKLLLPPGQARFEPGLLDRLCGLAVFHIDEGSYKTNRIVVECFLVSRIDLATQMADQLSNYFRHNFHPKPDEVLVRLKHSCTETGVVAPPAELLNALKSVGFRWKMVENSDEGRFTVVARNLQASDAEAECANDLQLRQVNFLTHDAQLCFMRGRAADAVEFEASGLSAECEEHFVRLSGDSDLGNEGLRDCVRWKCTQNSRQLEADVDKLFRDQRDKNIRKMHFQSDTPSNAVCYTTQLAVRVPRLGYTQQMLNKRLACFTRLSFFHCWEGAGGVECFLCTTYDPEFRLFFARVNGSRSPQELAALLAEFETEINAPDTEIDEEIVAGRLWVPQFVRRGSFGTLATADARFQGYAKAELQFKHPVNASDLNTDVAHLDKKIKSDFLFALFTVDRCQGLLRALFHTLVTRQQFVYCE